MAVLVIDNVPFVGEWENEEDILNWKKAIRSFCDTLTGDYGWSLGLHPPERS